ncbi:uncharacterized protein EI90DRAFT_1571728 [Cantharellus anzutake]|uniref:uncharacterized protein n=1 Tax=Cantharellus anzutake TaxID=1750568 RepID=UPI0019074AB3|nr:uncharacterized protein EI90DRAFT_1571728 [Cantharellus anzutake]KAF8328410.1 hypothetical protein EI90DRAFT_1571728 [Cantharellus anzutake]
MLGRSVFPLAFTGKRQFVRLVLDIHQVSQSLRHSTIQPLNRRTAPRRWAASTSVTSSPNDPADYEANKALEAGTKLLEEGDVDGAKAMYKRSVDIKRTASALFNLGVTYYHSKEYPEAIGAWEESISLQPSSPDAHTNLASAYIMSPVSRPDLALKHLRTASSLSPDDPEISFNLAAVLEACGFLEEALDHYKRSKENGVERAGVHIRNVSAKILGKRMKEAAGGDQRDE